MPEGQIMVVAECTISPGELDTFKKLAQETINAVNAGSNVVGYRRNFNNDQTKFVCVRAPLVPHTLFLTTNNDSSTSLDRTTAILDKIHRGGEKLDDTI
jgi:hypothetical protein